MEACPAWVRSGDVEGLLCEEDAKKRQGGRDERNVEEAEEGQVFLFHLGFESRLPHTRKAIAASVHFASSSSFGSSGSTSPDRGACVSVSSSSSFFLCSRLERED